MIIIGEKLNGAIPSVARMVAGRDEEKIRELACRQAGAGADFIDVCAAVEFGEAETLCWLVEVVQSAVDVPVCIDSPDVEVLKTVYPVCKRPGIFNSVSLESRKQIDDIFRIMAENPGWEAVAMLCDDRGIAHSSLPGERLRIFEEILKKAEAQGIEPSRLYIDPMVGAAAVMGLDGTEEMGIQEFLRTIRTVRAICPEVHITSAVSNISHGLPARKYLNYSFLAMAMEAGLDSAICDPLNKGMQGMICASEILLGRVGEEGCMEYVRGHRNGKF